MLRTILVILASLISLWFVIDWIHTSDRERVEATLEELVEIARRGGDDAVDEILAAFADDYRGEGPYKLRNIESYLRRYVGKERVEALKTGGFKAVWAGSELYVPLFTVKHEGITVVVEIWFSEHADGEWKITKVSRPKIAR